MALSKWGQIVAILAIVAMFVFLVVRMVRAIVALDGDITEVYVGLLILLTLIVERITPIVFPKSTFVAPTILRKSS